MHSIDIYMLPTLVLQLFPRLAGHLSKSVTNQGISPLILMFILYPPLVRAMKEKLIHTNTNTYAYMDIQTPTNIEIHIHIHMHIHIHIHISS